MTRLSFEIQASFGKKLGTKGCEASPLLYGNALNRLKGEASVGCVKPSQNIVEATITRASGGLATSKKKDRSLSNVFVVDTNKQPLNPVHPGRARLLLSQGKAAVLKHFPFTIVLKVEIHDPEITPLRIKIDPGSKTTGIALVHDTSGAVVFAAEVSHRGQTIKAALDDRRAIRHSRRNRKTRYRQARFLNRNNKKHGWLPPSLESRISNVETWVNRLRRVCPLTAISLELVRFDTQLMENAEISSLEYQQGTLQGYETREYLLEKWQRTCAYCGAKEVPLQIEHIHPRSRGGSDRLSNLTLACEPCNKAKDIFPIEVFLAEKPDVLQRILSQVKQPLKDAAAVNATRWKLFERLKETGLPIECGSGGLTKYNRTQRELPKEHWLDAACVGKSTPMALDTKRVKPLLIKAMGHGRRQFYLMDRFGFPRTKGKGAKIVQGFQTGDHVKACVLTGKNAGVYVGRVAVRATGFFNITTATQTVQGVNVRFCRLLHYADGYCYEKGERHSSHA